MSDYPSRVNAASRLVAWFGYWPDFHDAEVLWIKLERGNKRLQGDVTVEFLIHTWELIKDIDELKSQKHCLVHFAFENCADIRLEGFNQQNQLSTLEFIEEKQVLPPNNVVPTNAVVRIKNHDQFIAEDVLVVSFISEFGIGGSFKCDSGEVVSIEACDEDGILLGHSS